MRKEKKQFLPSLNMGGFSSLLAFTSVFVLSIALPVRAQVIAATVENESANGGEKKVAVVLPENMSKSRIKPEYLQLRESKESGDPPKLIIVDIANVISLGDSVYKIPILAKSDSIIHAVDFDMDYDQNMAKIVDVTSNVPENPTLSFAWNDYFGDRILLTSYTMEETGFAQPKSGTYFLHVKGSEITPKFILKGEAYINGKPVKLKVTGTITALDDLKAFEPPLVYPNPANGLLNLRFQNSAGQQLKVQLYSTLGTLVYQSGADIKAGANEFTVDLSPFPQGVYGLHIECDGKIYRQKVVKE